MRFVLSLFLVATLVSACTAPITQTPPPTPQVLTVALTPATRSWQPALRACADTLSQMRLLLEEIPLSRLDLDNGLSIRLGTPSIQSPYFAAQIGEEQIVIVVHPDNPLQELTGNALRSLYTGKVVSWDELGINYAQPVQVWSYSSSDELQQIFQSAIWKSNPPTIMAFLAPNPEAMLEAIAENPGAIGYLPSSWLTNSDLKPVSLEMEIQEALHQPVLLLSAQEPQGLARSLVSCLQATPK